MKSIYTAHSKHFFFFKDYITKFVLEMGHVPLNPFMLFSYFLTDTVDRELVRNANNAVISMVDEVWVFGPISDGVAKEILLAYKSLKPILYFKIVDSKKIYQIQTNNLIFEENAASYKSAILQINSGKDSE